MVSDRYRATKLDGEFGVRYRMLPLRSIATEFKALDRSRNCLAGNGVTAEACVNSTMNSGRGTCVPVQFE